MTRNVELRLHNDLAEIGAARDALDNLASEFGVPMPALMSLQVALDEAVSNVVKYAWDDGARHEFLVQITLHPDRIDLEIVDDGREFNPLSAALPEPPAAAQRPKPGGLGIHMVKRLVDGFTYQRVDGRNHTTLSKRFVVGAAAQGNNT